MNSLDLHRQALALDKPQRVPVAPSFLTRAVRVSGMRQHDYHTDPHVLARAQIDHCERYDFDGVYISSDNVILYEALGGQIVFPDADSYPMWTEPLVASPRDLSSLHWPEPERDGRMPVVIQAAALAMDLVGHRRFVLANIDSGPFQLALTLMGMERGFVTLMERPAEMCDILEFCAEVTILYGKAMAQTGCHGLQFGESTAALLGRNRYRDVVWPYDCRVIEALRQTGAYVFLHVCGDSTSVFDLLVQSGAHCIEFDSQVDPRVAQRLAAGKVALKGNVDTGHFLTSSPAQMEQECCGLIETMGQQGGFILAGGCEVPAAASDDVLSAMRRAADVCARPKRA